jgi:flagellar hook-associated protein 3 FlgL
MRVTTSMTRQTMVKDMNQNLRRLQETQQQIASGKRLTKPSDDPLNVAEAMRLRSQTRATQMYQRHAADARGRLEIADNTLNTVNTRLIRVRDLVLSAINASADPGSRTALAAEITEIRSELLGLANSVLQGSALFGGTIGASQAYDATTGAYLGNGQYELRRLGPEATVEVGVPGPDVFGPETDNLFNILNDLAAAVTTNTGIGAATARLDGAIEQASLTHAAIGVRARRVDATMDRLEVQNFELRNALSIVEDTDIAAASIDFATRQASYEASLSVAARSLQTSLLDYLR